MSTFRDVPGLTLTAKQQQVLAAAVTTPAVTDSLQRITEQMLDEVPVLAAFHRRIAEAFTTPVERAHAEHAERSRLISDAFRPVATARMSVATAPDLQPVFDRIVKRQQDWAAALAVPLAQGFGSAAWTSTSVPMDLFAGLQRIRVVSPLPVELPDVAGWDRLARLVSEGRFDAATVAAAETDVAGDAETSEAIDGAAEMLAQQRPERSVAQWRKTIVVAVWAMWILALAGAGWVVPAELIAAISAAVGKAAQVTGEAAGGWVDRRSVTGQDVEDR